MDRTLAEFKGVECGIRLFVDERNEVMMCLLSEDDEYWSEGSSRMGTCRLVELKTQLDRAHKWLLRYCKPDGTGWILKGSAIPARGGT
jgi:hypothetical protein